LATLLGLAWVLNHSEGGCRMAYDRITPEARRRMKRVLRLRKEGKTFFEIGRELKVTRERVRQLENLAGHLQELGKL